MTRKLSEILAEESKGSTESAPAKPVRKLSQVAAEEDKAKPQGFMGKVGAAAMDYAVKPTLAAVGFVGEKLDRFSPIMGAPMRSGIGAVQQDRIDRGGRTEGLRKFLDPEEYKDVGRFASAFAKSYGDDPEKAPTPGDNMAGYGVPRTAVSDVLPSLYSESGEGPTLKRGGLLDPTAAGAAGLAAQVVSPVGIGAGGMRAIAPVSRMAGKVGVKTAETVAKVADAATGTKAASKVLGAAESGMNNLSDALKARFGTDLAPDAPKHIKTMIDNGIDPNKANAAVMFGPTSAASHLERARGETPIGEILRKQHQDFTTEVQEAIHKDIRRIGGETADAAGNIKAASIPKTTEEAGELITSAFNKRVEEILDGSQDTYKSLAGKAPGAKIPPASAQKLGQKLDQLAKHATDMGIDSFDDVTESQAKHLLSVVDKVRAGQGDLASTVRGLQGLGKTAFKTKYPLGQIPPDIAKLRQLYGDISEAVVDGVEAHFGKDVAAGLRKNNAAISEMFKDNAMIPSLGNDAKSADKVFRSLILEGDAKRIGIIKKYLTPEELQQTKAAALEILNKEDIQGGITFRNRLSQKLSDPSDAMNALFEPGELDNLKSLFQLGDRAGKSTLSSSGTGGSLAHQAASWGNLVRPDKWLENAETAVDKIAAAKQKKTVSKAIGFELPEFSGKAAAKRPGRPPTMSFAPGEGGRTLPNFRARGSRAYFSTLGEDEDR